MADFSVNAVSIPGNVSLHETVHIGGRDLRNHTSLSGIVSDDVTDIFGIINIGILCGILSIFGTVTNVINIIVFVKTGFKDAVNVSFLALAISDLGCCFTLIIMALCFNPYFANLDLPFEPKDFQYLTSGWPHIIFTRITSCITAFITFERCLCVSFPLKVKEIITPKRAAIVHACATIAVVILTIPEFLSAGFEWKFIEQRNRSVLVLVIFHEYEELHHITEPIQGIFVPFATFLVVLVSTVVLVLNLKRKAKWREDAIKSSNSLSARDAKVSKIVVVISTMFIVCYLPVMASYTAMILVPEYHIKRRYENLNFVVFSFHYFTETLNSTLNIFIYYRVSSVYKTIFRQLFGFNLNTNENYKTQSLPD